MKSVKESFIHENDRSRDPIPVMVLTKNIPYILRVNNSSIFDSFRRNSRTQFLLKKKILTSKKIVAITYFYDVAMTRVLLTRSRDVQDFVPPLRFPSFRLRLR